MQQVACLRSHYNLVVAGTRSITDRVVRIPNIVVRRTKMIGHHDARLHVVAQGKRLAVFLHSGRAVIQIPVAGARNGDRGAHLRVGIADSRASPS